MGEQAAAQALPAALARAWGIAAGAAPRRGPKARLTLDEITDVAVLLADEGGYARCSLTAIAARLGVSTNALYRYLTSRGELDVLMGERALGEPPVLPVGDWKESVRLWATAMRARHERHPWLVDVQGYVPLLPRVLGWLDVLLAALTSSGMPLAEALRAATTIDGYVRAGAIRDRETRASSRQAEHGLWHTPEASSAVAGLARERGWTHSAAVLAEGLFLTAALEDDDAWDEGLDLLLEALAGRLTGPRARSGRER